MTKIVFSLGIILHYVGQAWLAQVVIYTASLTSPSFGFIPLKGMVKLKMLPLPSSVSNHIFPPQPSTNNLTKERPNPEPSGTIFRAFSALKNFSNNLACCALGIPIPLSLTEYWAKLSFLIIFTQMVAFSG